MYTLKTEHSFDAAHFLYGYEGKCSNIHGHRWRVVLEVSGEELTDEGQMRGMLIDFGDLKKDLKEEVDYLDHMAKYFYDKMQDRGYTVKEVTVYETPNNAATYSR